MLKHVVFYSFELELLSIPSLNIDRPNSTVGLDFPYKLHSSTILANHNDENQCILVFAMLAFAVKCMNITNAWI